MLFHFSHGYSGKPMGLQQLRASAYLDRGMTWHSTCAKT